MRKGVGKCLTEVNAADGEGIVLVALIKRCTLCKVDGALNTFGD